MNEAEFFEKWHIEKPFYQAWGNFVVSKINSSIELLGYDINNYVKITPFARIKDNNSLIDKAFYRPDKSYEQPYDDIEDKVGCRFVVLLIDQVEQIADIIRSDTSWIAEECRHFNDERNKSPLLFTYQSVHFVVRAKGNIEFDGITIPESTPCEIQIRTLLQHAYAELTHDSIYKTNKIVKPEIHRTVAKSMALIETTDDFFKEVSTSLQGPIEQYDIVSILDSLYAEFLSSPPLKLQKSSYYVLDAFEDLFENKFQLRIRKIIENDAYDLVNVIKTKAHKNPFYKQSISIFTGWLIIERKNRVVRDWPLDSDLLEEFASALSVSLDL
ncbi:GTP pyrophosphokinase family protein [Providencia huaxiensis]|uniref:GTP pyrophosphokinase n=1 Tax=Providencia TaxID=586 RepID=UPI001B36EEE9|nr:RelA/SpoT domain-containing protein [Providencia rettgeri]EJD6370313.1 RelA/SpoT domain-containing protein [Providencia rettgeri]EJD6374825.1 RelA/SpoT domain-containing protein [Providencia rettgeri]ELR5033165.1 RelA/SpoT domain-containing protein [Providencia rettgeri]ELR5159929.1 RelA/SpoT domain-containing protein [Providencia rettgeri]ELR5208997.1 RelA/SpoT domain-containing protein [Providencia rettgeri]